MKSVVLCAIVLLGGCVREDAKKKYGRIEMEEVRIVKRVHTPSREETVYYPTIEPGQFWTVISKVPEEYAIVFTCQHGVEEVLKGGKDSPTHRMWERLSDGQKTTIRYRATFEGTRFVGYEHLTEE